MGYGNNGNNGRRPDNRDSNAHRHAHEQFHKHAHEEFRKQQEELRRYHRELRKRQQEEFNRRQHEMHQQHKFYKHNEEMHQYFKYYKISRPPVFLFNLLVICLLFRFVGIKSLAIVFVAFFIIKEAIQLFFLRHLEKRVMKPIDRLKNGVEEIARGNYDVEIENDIPNEIGVLIASFNAMAQKLKEGERVKAEYEENRKNLIANISHDLKTPITSIQGYIEAIMDAELPPENMKKYLSVIYNNANYMNKLIDDLFLFSKLDMQKLDFHFESLGIKAFMADMMEEFKFEIEEMQARLEYSDRLAEACKVSIDRKRLHQVMRNIIGNAVKYGPEEGLVIKVDMYGEEDSVYIDIRDNGYGIPEDKLENIFDRFYRLDTERTKDPASTGLGLAIARELVEAHGGGITVSSKAGEGACFTIELPVESAAEEGEETGYEANSDN